MSDRSLIRKNQLHPDIADLVSGYGEDIFVTNQELNTLFSNLNIAQLTGQSIVYTTGNQNISGIKNFLLRPTFNGSGLATTGEVNITPVINFTGNRPITLNVSGFLGLNPGGNNIVDFLNNLFYPFTSGSITLNSFNTQELGRTTTNINFSGIINTGSLNLSQITNVAGYVNNVGRLPFLSPVVQNFNWSVNISLSQSSTNVFVKASGLNRNNQPVEIQSNVRSIIFEAPSYAGSGIDNLQSNPSNMKSVLSAQNKFVMTKPLSQTVSINTNNNWFYFVYPDTWGALSNISISQFNNFAPTDFVTGHVLINLDNGVPYLYRFYKRSIPTTLTNYNVIYNF